MKAHKNSNYVEDTLIVAYNYNPKKDHPVIVVGRRNASTRKTEIVNSFFGEDATDLYKLLTVKKTDDFEGDMINIVPADEKKGTPYAK